MAHLWAAQNETEHVCMPADWGRHGRAAGPIRNQEMLDVGGHDLVVAVNRDWAKSKGTNDMVKRCERAGIPVVKITSPLAEPDPKMTLF